MSEEKKWTMGRGSESYVTLAANLTLRVMPYVDRNEWHWAVRAGGWDVASGEVSIEQPLAEVRRIAEEAAKLWLQKFHEEALATLDSLNPFRSYPPLPPPAKKSRKAKA